MNFATKQQVTCALLIWAALCVCLAGCEQQPSDTFKEGANDDRFVLDLPEGRPQGSSRPLDSVASSARANSRLLSVPHSLARFIFYNSRQGGLERAQAGQAPLASSGGVGSKRSSSQLDTLTGVTIGKRSAPVELVNFEPLFGRQNPLKRPPSRVYDVRWAPMDSIESPSSSSSDY